MQEEINWLAEFKDAEMEKEFYDGEVRKGLRVSGKIVLIFSIINALFVIFDYLYLTYADITVVIYHSLIPRLVILAAAIFVFFLLKKAENKSTAIKSVIVFAVLTYLLHEYTAMHFAPVDLVFEVLDLVILTYGLFIVPNRWITNVCTSTFLLLVFIVLTPYTIPTISTGTKITIMIYLFSQVLIVGVLMYRIHMQKRLNYLQQLRLEVLAKTDVLTKAFNRVACDRALAQMCDNQCGFSLILVDIDDFKQINDTYGHLVGDKVIIKTVDVIKSVIRHNDLVARWGGEEFVIILPHTGLESAVEIACRIQKFLPMPVHDNAADKITASFGVTEFVKGDDMNSIVNRADQLLYMAKNQGKNVVISG